MCVFTSVGSGIEIPGGSLFHQFIMISGSQISRDLYANADEIMADPTSSADNISLGMEIYEECIETNAVKFQSWIMLMLNNMGTAAQKQLFYLSLFLEGKGLAVRGREVVSKLGWGMLRTTYHRHKMALVKEQQETIRYLSVTTRQMTQID